MGGQITKEEIIDQVNLLRNIHRHTDNERTRDFTIESDKNYNSFVQDINNSSFIKSNILNNINNIIRNKCSSILTTNQRIKSRDINLKEVTNINDMYNLFSYTVPSGIIYESNLNLLKNKINSFSRCHCQCHNNCHSDCKGTSGCSDGR